MTEEEDILFLDEESEEQVEEDFGPEIPVSVEETGQVLNIIKERYGEDQAYLLQQRWGDKTLHNIKISDAVIADNPVFDEIFDTYQSDDNGITRDGADLVAARLAQMDGLEDAEALFSKYPEILAIITENSDEHSLSA